MKCVNKKFNKILKLIILTLLSTLLTLKISYSEGVKEINIIGNEVFDNEELLQGFELSEGSFFSFLNNDNAYSREKLKGDIETLESFYKDRGYLKFSVESSQISLSRDMKSIYINFNIFEGKKYSISDKRLLEMFLLKRRSILQ